MLNLGAFLAAIISMTIIRHARKTGKTIKINATTVGLSWPRVVGSGFIKTEFSIRHAQLPKFSLSAGSTGMT